LTVVGIFLFFLWVAQPVSAADGLYTAETDDGVTLKMKRYRPAPEAAFRNGAQPILLFTGIMCNMNIYLTHTPEERRDDYKDMTLPIPLAPWAKDDPYIKADPMRYYSLAHYLWVKGYDVWLANYRGTGRGEFRSDMGNMLTNNDVWGILDADACVKKVVAETGKRPFIGGHSTGGFVCHAYLQGAYFDPKELEDGAKAGYIPHVRSNPELARSRNALIKGYIAIDPGLTPILPTSIDTYCMWKAFGKPDHLDLDSALDNGLNRYVTDSDITAFFIDKYFNHINRHSELQARKQGLMSVQNFWFMYNSHPYVTDYFIRYAASGAYIRGLGQWGDIALNHRIREFWKNGIENKDVAKGPKPDPDKDGYYYYDRHMQLLTLPTLAVMSYSGAMVHAQDIVGMLMEAKTPNPGDEYHLIPNSAHLDITDGLNAPYVTYPYIGDWLDRQTNGAGMPEAEAASADQVGDARCN